MAEFCKECFIDGLITSQERRDYEAGKYTIIESDDKDICEGCCEYKPYVVGAYY